MKAARIALVVTTVAALGSGGVVLVGSAHAASGDTWSGFKVVDVQPAATTQTAVLGLMPRYHQGSTDLYLWNVVRMVTDANGDEAWVFCVQEAQGGDSSTYTEDPVDGSTAAGRAHLPEIDRVLADSTLPLPGALDVTSPDPAYANPAVDVLPARRSDHIEVTAVQLALWHYTDGFDFTTSNTSIARDYYPSSFHGSARTVTIGEVLARYDALVADADARPLTNPDPRITVTSSASSVSAGSRVDFTVTGTDLDGPITLGTDDHSVVLGTPGSGSSCDTTPAVTSLPAAGGSVCAVLPSAGSLTLTARGESTGTTAHVLYAPDAQSLIGIAPGSASAQAQVMWTAATSSPSPSSSSSSSPTSSPSTSASVSATSTPSASPSATTSVLATSTPGAGTVLSTSSAGNASAGTSATRASTGVLGLAATGPIGLLRDLALALLAVGLGTLLVLATRRRTAR